MRTVAVLVMSVIHRCTFPQFSIASGPARCGEKRAGTRAHVPCRSRRAAHDWDEAATPVDAALTRPANGRADRFT